MANVWESTVPKRLKNQKLSDYRNLYLTKTNIMSSFANSKKRRQ